MSTLQYVGARYVPKLFDDGQGGMEWQENTYYEPLTIVTYNNTSYTSRGPVSASVGNPAENGEYWAMTGNFNAQLSEALLRLDAKLDSFATYSEAIGKKTRYFKTIGFHKEGDGGDGVYIVTDSPTEMSIPFGNKYAVLVADYVNMRALGASESSLNNSELFDIALKYGLPVSFPKGTYTLTSPLHIDTGLHRMKIDCSLATFIYNGSDCAIRITNSEFLDLAIGTIQSAGDGIRIDDSDGNYSDFLEIHDGYITAKRGIVLDRTDQFINEVHFYSIDIAASSVGVLLSINKSTGTINGMQFDNVNIEASTPTAFEFNAISGVIKEISINYPRTSEFFSSGHVFLKTQGAVEGIVIIANNTLFKNTGLFANYFNLSSSTTGINVINGYSLLSYAGRWISNAFSDILHGAVYKSVHTIGPSSNVGLGKYSGKLCWISVYNENVNTSAIIDLDSNKINYLTHTGIGILSTLNGITLLNSTSSSQTVYVISGEIR